VRPLAKSLSQHMLIYSASGTASGQFPIDHNGRQTTNAVLFSTAGSLMLMHIMDLDFVLRAHELLDGIDRFLTGCASRAKDLDFMFHSCVSPFLPSFAPESASAEMQAGQTATCARRGNAFQTEARTSRPTPE
jgi:hypothetical protein